MTYDWSRGLRGGEDAGDVPAQASLLDHRVAALSLATLAAMCLVDGEV